MPNEPRWRKGDPIWIDTFRAVCGFDESESGVNGGYGCTHPEQRERHEDDDGREHGCCYQWSCPLATALQPETEPEDAAAMRAAWGLAADAPLDGGDDLWVMPIADGPSE